MTSSITPQIKNILPDLLNEYSDLIPADSKSTVLNYSGQDGLKQVTLNSLTAKNELVIFEIGTMSSFLDYDFSEKVRKIFVDKKIKVREITNHDSQDPWTQVEEFVKKFWDCRYINPQTLKIDIETLVYNDTVALYSYKNGHIFCVEIRNPNLAKMQKQMFDFVWSQAKKLKIGPGGSTSL
ncbi:hypothetical protein A3H89_05520 [Candidatus Amesbacteria bacterium RIFCSPLOWO2_02_FULL_48_11]|uniref:Uncharacterized protein n=5 Tax=Candidatus Amesiibacteriota TaxID=1752730 RepID=A0A1F4ZC88_9BACT|nr:MAG: hypothetical protein UX78_C0002G0038 [Candidatus Amesbacteria bacterium GW2011_GWA2_47_11]KKU92650.1 MAG: hypothetical protein UY22_C0029G0007 [Candidatus Amesbacteria bacterium GW2011_GWC1_48_10]KKW00830.1 MAG: hypothetical protein UY33_C0004G0016 [Candidatus Amesbacteria bacterium GW2011_GWA1_48_9]OGC90418.1 MAG: hypothetical protein A2V48_04725 [Candidatus Amesbacteria bacterium RBG_19FT_COMBO_48_16]OGC96995.1 MAG: hypothetical protein A3C34_00260 [Candidatus Amesbacteria bacterium R